MKTEKMENLWKTMESAIDLSEEEKIQIYYELIRARNSRANGERPVYYITGGLLPGRVKEGIPHGNERIFGEFVHLVRLLLILSEYPSVGDLSKIGLLDYFQFKPESLNMEDIKQFYSDIYRNLIKGFNSKENIKYWYAILHRIYIYFFSNGIDFRKLYSREKEWIKNTSEIVYERPNIKTIKEEMSFLFRMED